jgi:phosphoribosylaminoimidazolecarboxamide formyltransferase/IMP cyclohydrolase
VDLETAQKVSETFVEVVVAPGYESDAAALLSKKAAIRLLEIPASGARSRLDYRFLDGLCLVQEKDDKIITRADFQVVTKTAPTSAQSVDLELAFQLVKHVKSNAIVLVKEGQLIGTGAGQMSRVDSVRIALEKAGAKAQDAVAASDAFFPFKDGVELLVAGGVKAIVQPGGSKRDAESVEVCNMSGISMVYTGIRHFKH